MSVDLKVKEYQNWRVKILLIGAALGAAVGLGAAYLFVNQAEEGGDRPEVTAGDGVRLGLLILGLLRQVAALGDGNK